MSNVSVIVIVVLCAIAGVVVGGWAAARSMSSFVLYATADGAVAAVAVEGAALQKMRDGDAARAGKILEENVDGSLLVIASSVKNGYHLSPTAKAAIRRVKTLREATEYVPSEPTIHAAVENAFALAQP